ncbi:hypothetical protein NIES4106_37060 [Fischerella sp. NIES-4106]|nr:hypothetical protein NIES4106_37060 [Fischerella sp. NIES-4106]
MRLRFQSQAFFEHLGCSQLRFMAQKRHMHLKDWLWPFWPALPLYPYGRRQTYCHEVVEDTIWTFDQLHGILYTIVPIRMTVVSLETDGLLVYAPVAPTKENCNI